MAFDRTNPTDLAALKTEVNTDPISMGYDPNGATQLILKKLNDSAENVGGDTAARIFDCEALMDALDPDDLGAQQTTTGAAEYTQMLIGLSDNGRDITSYKTKWRNEFAGNSGTVVALDAQTSPLSRGEVLFGQGTVISREDWFAARDS